MGLSFKLTWLVLGEDPAARSRRVEQFTVPFPIYQAPLSNLPGLSFQICPGSSLIQVPFLIYFSDLPGPSFLIHQGPPLLIYQAPPFLSTGAPFLIYQAPLSNLPGHPFSIYQPPFLTVSYTHLTLPTICSV